MCVETSSRRKNLQRITQRNEKKTEKRIKSRGGKIKDSTIRIGEYSGKEGIRKKDF